MNEAKLKENRWDKSFEEEIVKEWKTNKTYAFNPKLKKKVYSIDTPPPYVNSPIHIGHATTYALMDMFARYKRMNGYSVLFPLGLDRNGLPIEMAAEKKFNIKLTTLTRDKALEHCESILADSSNESIDSFYKLGISFNSWEKGNNIGDIYHTDSEEYRKLTQNTFIELWNKGLVYEAERVNNYCPGCQTTIADAEIDYKEAQGNFYNIIFKIKESGEKLIIGTTRPELLGSCAMVIYNPEDERYKNLDGKTAITPLYNKEVKIKAHPQASLEKGTGLVMMCSFGDLADIRFFREQNLDPVILIEKDGKLNKNSGFLDGLRIKEARKKIIQKLEEEKLLESTKPTETHRTPICERSKDPIEFISQKEFYLKQIEFKENLKKISEKLNFYDARSRQILLDWIDSVSIDWPLSRRRYYATEIPLWKIEETGEYVAPEKGKYYRPWKEKAPKKLQEQYKGKTLIGETRVFDTWFDSATTPLYIAQWGSKFYEKNKPVSLRPQGKEIIRTWLYYTLLKTWLLTNEIAFQDVWINYHVVDEQGRKMSKSLGNGIDPHDILEKYGAEPFRLWCAIEGNITSTDLRCSFIRIEGAGKTLTKLWNVARFISMFENMQKPKKIEPLDQWILTEINKLANSTKECYEKYDFHNPATQLKNFLWETLASHYLELVKKRTYGEENGFTLEQKQSACYTLHEVLRTYLKLLAPINPIITAKVYQELYNENIHNLTFPKLSKIKETPFTKEQLMELNSLIWKTKKDNGKSLRDEITQITLPKHFKKIEQDIKLTHSINKIKYGELKITL